MHDYLYARTTHLSTRFEYFLQTQFNIGTVEWESFNIIEANLTQDISESVTVEAKDRPIDVQPISMNMNYQSKGDCTATAAEVAA